MSTVGRNICGISSLYLLSKTFKLSFSHDGNERYEYCINTMETAHILDAEDAYKTCAALNDVDILQTFVSDFAKGMMLIYVLFGTVVNRDIDIQYWSMAHVSALTFSYIGTLEEFQFSFDSSTTYDKFKLFVACGCLIILLPLTISNLITKTVAKGHIIGFLAYYAACYFLYLSATKDIEYHLHHSFVCTLVSYFYTDWSSKLNVYAHSILMGIAVQGLAFYKFDEYDMLNISNGIVIGGAEISIFYCFILTYLICSIANKVSLDDLDDGDDARNEDELYSNFLDTIEESIEEGV